MESLGLPFEILFVDDGSSDRSYELISEKSRADERVHGIRLSRNFGNQIAISAGIDMIRGQYAIVIDADMQDPPELIPAMMEKMREGYDLVYAVREQREGDSFFRRTMGCLFYKLIGALSDVPVPYNSSECRLMGPKVIAAYRQFKEHHRFFRGMTHWLGFRQTGVKFKRQARSFGVSKFHLFRLVRLAFDAITSFSTMPLRFAHFTGGLGLLVSLFLSLFVVYGKFILGTSSSGWASIMIAVIFFGSVQLFTVGILGEYIGRIYEEVKQRPLYIISEQTPPPAAADNPPAVAPKG